MRSLLALLTLALLTAATPSVANRTPFRTAIASGPAARGESALPASAVVCERPSTLRLRRFEDGSARLECGARLLVRVSVPG